MPIERKAETVLAVQEARDHRRRQQAAAHDLLRHRRRHERRFAGGFVGLLIGRSCDDQAHRTTTAIAESVALLEADPFGLAFQSRIENLDALFGDRDLTKVSPAFGLRTWLVLFVVVLSERDTELLGELLERRFLLGEL